MGFNLNYQLFKNFEVNVSSYPLAVLPFILGAKYQVFDYESGTSMAVSYRTSYTGANSDEYNVDNSNKTPDMTYHAHATSHILGFPFGWRINEDWRLIVNPQVTHIKDVYLLRQTLPDESKVANNYNLTAYRSAIAVSGAFKAGPMAELIFSGHIHDHKWNELESKSSYSFFVTITHELFSDLTVK